jgi:hypothetical protein
MQCSEKSLLLENNVNYASFELNDVQSNADNNSSYTSDEQNRVGYETANAKPNKLFNEYLILSGAQVTGYLNNSGFCIQRSLKIINIICNSIVHLSLFLVLYELYENHTFHYLANTSYLILKIILNIVAIDCVWINLWVGDGNLNFYENLINKINEPNELPNLLRYKDKSLSSCIKSFVNDMLINSKFVIIISVIWVLLPMIYIQSKIFNPFKFFKFSSLLFANFAHHFHIILFWYICTELANKRPRFDQLWMKIKDNVETMSQSEYLNFLKEFKLWYNKHSSVIKYCNDKIKYFVIPFLLVQTFLLFMLIIQFYSMLSGEKKLSYLIGFSLEIIIDSLIILISFIFALNSLYLNDAKILYIEIYKHLQIDIYCEQVTVKVRILFNF